MLWSIVSDAAERRQRHRSLIFLRAHDIGEVVMDIQKSRLSIECYLQYADMVSIVTNLSLVGSMVIDIRMTCERDLV